MPCAEVTFVEATSSEELRALVPVQIFRAELAPVADARRRREYL
jgi:hypothetical protein